MSTIQHPNGAPVLASDDESIGWRKLSVGDTVPSQAQAFGFTPKVGWKLTSFYGRENERVSGRVEYRVPASFKAWLIVLPRLIPKMIKGYWKLLRSGGKTMV